MTTPPRTPDPPPSPANDLGQPDLLPKIYGFLDTPTLANCLRVSATSFEIAGPMLYETIQINPEHPYPLQPSAPRFARCPFSRRNLLRYTKRIIVESHRLNAPALPRIYIEGWRPHVTMQGADLITEKGDLTCGALDCPHIGRLTPIAIALRNSVTSFGFHDIQHAENYKRLASYRGYNRVEMTFERPYAAMAVLIERFWQVINQEPGASKGVGIKGKRKLPILVVRMTGGPRDLIDLSDIEGHPEPHPFLVMHLGQLMFEIAKLAVCPNVQILSYFSSISEPFNPRFWPTEKPTNSQRTKVDHCLYRSKGRCLRTSFDASG